MLIRIHNNSHVKYSSNGVLSSNISQQLAANVAHDVLVVDIN